MMNANILKSIAKFGFNTELWASLKTDNIFLNIISLTLISALGTISF